MNIARTSAEVVVEADERREHADDHEPRPAVLVRGSEDVELADEAAGERKPAKPSMNAHIETPSSGRSHRSRPCSRT
jgi:hypothetical protein